MPLSEARTKLLARLRRRKSREREGLFLVEGIRAAREAVDAGAPMTFAVVSPRLRELDGGRRLAERLTRAVETFEVEDPELEGLSAAESSQGVLVVCREPSPGLADLEVGGALSRLLVVDGIQDPGNLGTLVRAAAGFAHSGVIVLEGSVDPYNAKAVRGAAGALFRIVLVRARWESVVEWLRERRVRILLGDAQGADVGAVDRRPPWALVVGGEGAGARETLRGATDERVAIPMPGGTESLNAGVAGAILLYALTREGPGD